MTILFNNKSILPTGNRYNHSYKKDNRSLNVTDNQNVPKEIPPAITKPELTGEMQVHFGNLGPNEQSFMIREPDIKQLINCVEQQFGNFENALSEPDQASDSSLKAGQEEKDSEQLINSFVKSYTRNAKKYLAVFSLS